MSARPEIDWYTEVSFWYKKHSRAFIRAEDALKRGDEIAADIASKQMELYARRADAATPESLKNEIDESEAAERIAAFKE